MRMSAKADMRVRDASLRDAPHHEDVGWVELLRDPTIAHANARELLRPHPEALGRAAAEPRRTRAATAVAVAHGSRRPPSLRFGGLLTMRQNYLAKGIERVSGGHASAFALRASADLNPT